MATLRKDGALLMDGIPLSRLADQFGTPMLVYSWNEIKSKYQRLTGAFDSLRHRIHYAVKANSNRHILSRFAAIGAGFDVVSGGELERVSRAGGAMRKTVFSGVGKTQEEISFALKIGVASLHIESAAELERVTDIARRLGITAPISMRVNPDVDPETHPYIATGMKENKFGLPSRQVRALLQEYQHNERLHIRGLACHIGSQIQAIEPYRDGLTSLIDLAENLARDGIEIETLNIGGGMSIRYEDEDPFDFDEFGAMVAEVLVERNADYEIQLEPGRALVGDAGALLTKVEYLKQAAEPDYRDFAVVDAAMNDLIRPSLYGAYHDVQRVDENLKGIRRDWEIVGPICESGDFLAKNRKLTLASNDLLAIMDTGAYVSTMESNYNSRLRIPEVLIEDDEYHLVRRRESINDLLRLEVDL